MRKVRDYSSVVAKLLLLLLVQRCAEAAEIEVPCPEFCECDVYGNLRRAVCRERKLVSIQLNIPSQAEILDLSYNQISDLGDKVFVELGLTNLKLLNLSHNKIGHIHFNGFVGLENVKSLDLSFNALEYFTQSWFESLQSLEEFYLRGNKLKSINDEAQIDIQSLRILDISKCGITSLNAKTFAYLPNLQMLDISENYMQRIKVDMLKTLPKLVSLKANDNNFNCKDTFLSNVRNYIKANKIHFTDSCLDEVEPSFSVNYQVQKFAKMKMAEELDDSAAPNLTRNSWIFDEDKENNTKIIEICSNSTSDDGSLLMEIIHLSPWLTVSITFTYGVLCGMVLLCGINLCIQTKRKTVIPDTEMPDGSVSCNIRTTQNIPIVPRRDKNNTHRNATSVLYSTIQNARRHMSREDLEDDDYGETLVMNEFDLATSTPVVTRKPLST